MSKKPFKMPRLFSTDGYSKVNIKYTDKYGFVCVKTFASLSVSRASEEFTAAKLNENCTITAELHRGSLVYEYTYANGEERLVQKR